MDSYKIAGTSKDTFEEDLETISEEEEEQDGSNSDDEFHFYHPFSKTGARAAQNEDFARLLEETESESNEQDENELKQDETEPTEESEATTTEISSDTTSSGEVTRKKRNFFSKVFHWRGSSNNNNNNKKKVKISSTIKDIGSGDDKKKETKKDVKKNKEITLWGTQTDKLIGDCSKPYALPVIMGLHPDLKSITPVVLIRLMKGLYEKEIESFRLLDCRYPYEYEGGHIRTALNIYTRDQIVYLLKGKEKDVDDQRNILIFYCEFSSERAPSLSRYLREQDRKLNKAWYPKLNYPEVYLLAGGYKKFFADNPLWCHPQSYTPMLDPEHAHELHYFRMKLKQNMYACNENDNFETKSKSIFYNKLGLRSAHY